MAFERRTTEEIIADAIAIIQANGDLYDVADDEKLNSPSAVSVWKQLVSSLAGEVAILEMLMEDLVAEIEVRALEIPSTNLRWYAAETLKYQHGDSLTVIDGVTRYATIADDDDASRVVKLSSANYESGRIVVKAAGEDVDGNPEELTAAQKSGLESYWFEYRSAGDSVQVISQPPDMTKVFARVEVDGSLIGSDGTNSDGDRPVDDAIKEYLKNLDFSGRFLRSKLEDAIQAVNGVKNVVITAVRVQADGVVGYSNVINNDAQMYYSIAGFMRESTDETFSDTITYIAV